MIRYNLTKLSKISGIYLLSIALPILISYLLIKTTETKIGINVSGILGCLLAITYGIILIILAKKSKNTHQKIIKISKNKNILSVNEISKQIGLNVKRTKIAIYELKTLSKISYWSKVID